MAYNVQTLKANLRKSMEKRGIGASELARRMDLTPSSISPFISDNRDWNPTISTLVKIAEALEITPQELICGFEDQTISIKDIKQEFDSLKSSISPIENLPSNVVDALRLVSKPVEIEILTAVLKGFGYLKQGH